MHSVLWWQRKIPDFDASVKNFDVIASLNELSAVPAKAWIVILKRQNVILEKFSKFY